MEINYNELLKLPQLSPKTLDYEQDLLVNYHLSEISIHASDSKFFEGSVNVCWLNIQSSPVKCTPSEPDKNVHPTQVGCTIDKNVQVNLILLDQSCSGNGIFF
ncbi:hypothetical protein RF11_09349 [Thelohanellus kitauei]|uniref:Uncharacterized protein n=1 Tax=Thelohanellus kitauei TaxID=669202 RepID=A0A0C2MJ88_THEKT|nr:hypothetical protein RF11_09349 [Thelohanellus kitauei]